MRDLQAWREEAAEIRAGGERWVMMLEVEPVLKVYLLSSPSVESGGAPLVIARRQVRALLYRLAAELQPLPREQLCFLFWPDTPEATAHRNLTGLLSHLRRALPVAQVLVAEDERIWLDPALVWSDTWALEQAGSRAIELYRGPFLDGFSLPECAEFETWASLERQSWERRYLDALRALIDEKAARGELAGAIDYARRYLAIDELAEDVHRRLIELYTAAGERGAAMHQYAQCVAVLERELGVSPLPETMAAYQAGLDRQRPVALAPAAAAHLPLVAEHKWTILPTLSTPLVGRDQALRQLESAFERARSHQGGVILIAGEPGIGKSRLIQDFAGWLASRALVLAGGAYPETRATPYQPIAEALRPALLAHHASLGAASCCLAEASRLIPELRVLYPHLPPPAGLASDRTALFEALCRLVLALAEHAGPAVLCLDDLHWADESTLDWLGFLGQRLANQPLLVVGAFRPDEGAALTELRHSLSRRGCLSELELVGLDQGAVEQMLRSLAGTWPGVDRLAGQLHEATDGNPFFLLEILRAFLESGHDLEELATLANLPTPETVRDAVEARVARLSPQARQVLEAGAVLGRGLDTDLLLETAGRQELEVIDAVDELVTRQLLMADGEGYRFRHELIRIAVVRSQSPWRRRVLHRRAGEALEARQIDDPAILASHFEQAGEPGRAADYALRAGRAAKAVFAHIEARNWFDHTLALLEAEVAAQREPTALAAIWRRQIEALDERGWGLRLVGDMEAYARDLEEVARLVHQLGDPLTMAHLRWRQAYAHRWFCHYAQARAAAEEGVALAQTAGDARLEALCLREMGMAARERGDLGAAQAALDRALALFRDIGDQVFEIHTLGNLATLHWYLGDYRQALALGQESLARCDAAGLSLERRLPLGDMGAAAAALGDGESARQWLDESLAIAGQIADRTQEILCRVHLGWLALRQLEPAEARAHLQAGLDLAEEIGSCAEQGWLVCGLAEAHRQLGEHHQAAVHAHRALELAQVTGRPYDEGLARRILRRLP